MHDRDDLRRALLSILDVDEPVVVGLRHEPGPAAARLFVSLGAGWVVDADADPCVRHCARKECAVGVSLPPRHPVSPQKARALARAAALRNGVPGLEERGPQAEESANVYRPVSVSAATNGEQPSRSSSPVRGQTHKTARWTRAAVVAAIKAYAAEHGYPPSSHDWRTSDDDHPNSSWVKKLFGSWADAVVAAGFERPTRGRSGKVRRKSELGPTSSEREAGVSEATRHSLAGSEPRASSSEAPTRSEEAELRLLDESTSAVVAELLRRLATAIDVGLFRGGNLALMFEGLAEEVSQRIDKVAA